MRYLVSFLRVCGLVLIAFMGCMDFGDSDSEGCSLYENKCEGVVCDSDGNQCTWDCNPATGTCDYIPVEDGMECDFHGLAGVCVAGVCGENLCKDVVCDDDDECTWDACKYATGTCDYTPVGDGVICDDANDKECTYDYCIGGSCTGTGERLPNGVACDFEGLSGICVEGVCEENLCEDVVCEDDGNECTRDCHPAIGTCDYAPVGDGTACSDGVCLDGVCGALVGQCTADDLAEIEAGSQPDISVVIDCAIAAIDAVDCLSSVTGCLRASGTTLSEECSSCFALQACCAMYQCSLLVGGPCHVGNPMSGDCVMCVEAMCRSHVNLCVGGQ